MGKLVLLLFTLAFVLCVFPSGAFAFGAGNVPSYAFFEGIAFRHGDIEDVLAELLKRTGTGLLNRGGKFGGLDIKRVYFGNWLRDYSQAIDIMSLKTVDLQKIMNILMVLGFLAHGYVTDEFEITEERLGVYLPVEHIDNPRGYGGGEDPRKYHSKLRPPVDPRELEIDPRSGMKNYIANEFGNWDTSKGFVRRTLTECIRLGRQYRSTGSSNKPLQHEAFRLLGTGLHTLEDFSAHSNFCELALASLGYRDVFQHVGENVRIQAPNGRWVAPLVTGTFGGDDFIHSLLGEAVDHISQASVSDLNEEVENAKIQASTQRTGDIATIKNLLGKIPSAESQSMQSDMDKMSSGPTKDPNLMSPSELHDQIWGVLVFRDNLVKRIEKTIEKIPGLGPLLDSLMENITVWVFTTLEPYLKPVMQVATTQLQDASGSVVNGQDQYEVFNNPNASDPTHSQLSKDHFNLILNEPAGNIAKIIVIHTVKAVISAWDDPSIPVHQVTDGVLEAFFHPDFHDRQSSVQKEMLEYMQAWINGHTADDTIQRLTKRSVRNHENIRKEGDTTTAVSVSASTHGVNIQQGNKGHGLLSSALGGPLGNQLGKVPGVAQAEQMMSKLGLGSIVGDQDKKKKDKDKDKSSAPSTPSYQQTVTPSYGGGGQASYGGGHSQPSYGGHYGSGAALSNTSGPGGLLAPPSGGGGHGYYEGSQYLGRKNSHLSTAYGRKTPARVGRAGAGASGHGHGHSHGTTGVGLGTAGAGGAHYGAHAQSPYNAPSMPGAYNAPSAPPQQYQQHQGYNAPKVKDRNKYDSESEDSDPDPYKKKDKKDKKDKDKDKKDKKDKDKKHKHEDSGSGYPGTYAGHHSSGGYDGQSQGYNTGYSAPSYNAPPPNTSGYGGSHGSGFPQPSYGAPPGGYGPPGGSGYSTGGPSFPNPSVGGYNAPSNPPPQGPPGGPNFPSAHPSGYPSNRPYGY